MGMVVTEERLKKTIATEQVFRDEGGKFDPNLFHRILQINNLSEAQYVDDLGKEIRRRQMADAVTGVTSAPRTLAEVMYAYRKELRVAEAALVPKSMAPPPTEPEPAALEAFYGTISGEFQAPELRNVSLLSLKSKDLLDEISPAGDEALREEFELRRDELSKPELRRIEQIVRPDQASASAIKSRIDGGMSFEEAALSDDGGAMVDLGTQSHEELAAQVPELADAVFALEASPVSAPIESPFGWHIVRVIEVQAAKEATFEGVRTVLAEDLAMRAAVDSLVSVANQLDDELAAGSSLEDAARALNLQLRRIPAIDRQGRDAAGSRIEDLPARDVVVRLAFDTEVGEESVLSETDEGDYVIVKVNSITPAATRPLAEVREKVIERWRGSQRDEWARETAGALAERVRTGQDLSELAEADGFKVETLEPLDRFGSTPGVTSSRELAGKLFEIAPGETTVAAAPEGYLVAKLLEVRPADPGSDRPTVDALRDGLAKALGSDLLAAFSADLRREHEVYVNQPLIDQMLAGF